MRGRRDAQGQVLGGPGPDSVRAWWSTAPGWFLGAAVTAWILWGPLLVFAYPGREAHLILGAGSEVCVRW